MNNIMKYKGYIGSVEFSEEDCLFYGKVQGIRALISYEGESAVALIQDFHDSVDSYLSSCLAEGKEAEIAYKGSFNIRIPPELHRKAALYAIAHQMSLNSFVDHCIRDTLARG